MSCRRLVFDTGPLSSFAVVARLDLLEAVCAGHAAWPLSVQRELRAGTRAQPALAGVLEAAFLGPPDVLERPADLLEVELLRLRLAGSSLGPHHNRGEAEAIFLARRRNGVFVSEDRDARVLAAGELGPGRVAGTPDLLARAVGLGLVSPAGAWDAHQAMLAAGRRPGCCPVTRTGRRGPPGPPRSSTSR
jgi:predicted nucleic acid-binding protein